MHCKNCGAVIPDGASFCEICGTSVSQRESNQEMVKQVAFDSGKGSVSSKSSKGGMGRAILSIFLCILIVLSGSYADLALLVRNAVSEEAVNDLVQEIEPSEVKLSFLEGESNQTLAEYFRDCAKDLFDVNMSEEEVEEILDEKRIKRFISEKLNDYVEDLLLETGDGVIEAKEIEELWVDNQEKLREITGVAMNEASIRNTVKALNDSGVLKETDISRYRDKYPEIFAKVKNLLSNWLVILCLILTLLLTICIFLVQSKKRNGFVYAGSCMIIIGGLNLLVFVLSDAMVSKLNRSIGFGRSFWRQMLEPIRTESVTVGLILVAVGVLLCLIIMFTKMIQKRWQGHHLG